MLHTQNTAQFHINKALLDFAQRFPVGRLTLHGADSEATQWAKTQLVSQESLVIGAVLALDLVESFTTLIRVELWAKKIEDGTLRYFGRMERGGILVGHLVLPNSMPQVTGEELHQIFLRMDLTSPFKVLEDGIVPLQVMDTIHNQIRAEVYDLGPEGVFIMMSQSMMDDMEAMVLHFVQTQVIPNMGSRNLAYDHGDLQKPRHIVVRDEEIEHSNCVGSVHWEGVGPLWADGNRTLQVASIHVLGQEPGLKLHFLERLHDHDCTFVIIAVNTWARGKYGSVKFVTGPQSSS